MIDKTTIGLCSAVRLGLTLVLAWGSLATAQDLPGLGDPRAPLLGPATAAAIAFVVTAATKLAVSPLPLLAEAVICLSVAVITYTVLCFRTGIRDADLLLRPVRRALWR